MQDIPHFKEAITTPPCNGAGRLNVAVTSSTCPVYCDGGVGPAAVQSSVGVCGSGGNTAHSASFEFAFLQLGQICILWAPCGFVQGCAGFQTPSWQQGTVATVQFKSRTSTHNFHNLIMLSLNKLPESSAHPMCLFWLQKYPTQVGFFWARPSHLESVSHQISKLRSSKGAVFQNGSGLHSIPQHFLHVIGRRCGNCCSPRFAHGRNTLLHAVALRTVLPRGLRGGATTETTSVPLKKLLLTALCQRRPAPHPCGDQVRFQDVGLMCAGSHGAFCHSS